MLHETQETGHTPMSDTAGANPEQGLRNWPKSLISVPPAFQRALAVCQQRPLCAMPRLRDCKQGLFQPALPMGPQGGSHGWIPHRKPWGSWTQHTFTHLRKKMRNSQDHKSFEPKVLRCKTSTSFSFTLRSSSKNGSWEYILNGKKWYAWNKHVGMQNSVIGGDSTQGHIAFGTDLLLPGIWNITNVIVASQWRCMS